MALSIKNLGEGQLPSSKGTLYTVPALTQAIVMRIVLVNEDGPAGGEVTCNLYANLSGTSRRIIPLNTTVADSYTFKGPLTLEAGDTIEGDASAATTIDYTISGVQNA